jgi:hypothetical protein
MKGEHICHQHAQQLDNQRRREQQRRVVLSRPGMGFESPAAIQRTLGAVVNALLAGKIDHKLAAQLIIQLQAASRGFSQHSLRPRTDCAGPPRVLS